MSSPSAPSCNGVNPGANVRPGLTLWICAALLVGLHLLVPFTAPPLSQAEPSFAGEVFPWLPIPTNETLSAATPGISQFRAGIPFIAVCIALFAVYAKMLRLLRGRQSRAVHLIVLIAGAAALLGYLFSPVMFSTDIFAYAMYGRAMSVFGGSPYAAEMANPTTDPYYIQFGLEYLPSWYGPVWTFISAGITWFTGENVGVTVLMFRLVAIVCALLASGLIWACLRKFSPENSARGLVLFLWNPLLVIETGLSGHNDSVMLVLVLLGIWLHLRGNKACAVLALTLSALVKFLTGMLVPLYILLVLRESKTWRERIAFVAASAIPAAAMAIALFHLAKADQDVPVAHSATAPDFYMNNFHELIFTGLRHAVGEDGESGKVPVLFYPYWLRLAEDASLHAEKSATSPIVHRSAAGSHLLLLSPGKSDWLRAYDPATHRTGWFTGASWDESKRPALANDDAFAREREKPVFEQRTVRTANGIVRIVTWFGFAAFGLFAAWRTRSFTEFLVWAAASLLGSYFFIITEIWPWYVNWSLALGALAPGRLPARLAMLLSAGVLTLYVTLGYGGSRPEWVFPYRGVLAFVLPLAAFIVTLIVQTRKSPPHAQPA